MSRGPGKAAASKSPAGAALSLREAMARLQYQVNYQ
jgi:hypothetical protein